MNLISNNIYIQSLSCFLISISISFITTPFLIRLGKKFNYLDYPSGRKKHKEEIVNIGGISIFFGIFLTIIPLYILIKFNLIPISNNIFNIIPILFFTNLIIFFTGLYDDKYSLSPNIRLSIQLISASLMWLMGLRIELLDLTFLFTKIDLLQLPIFLNYLITIVWIAGITNAINWLDGMDGLAAGVSLLIAFGMLFIGFNVSNNLAVIFCSLLIGSCLGFLFFNFKPAKIIMGDAGSNLLGFSLAITNILLLRGDQTLGVLPFSLILFFVPILDMLRVIFIRIKNKNSPFQADRNHLHFKLLKRNFSEEKVIFIIYNLVMISISICFHLFHFKLALPLFFISFILLLILVFKKDSKTYITRK